MNVFEDLIVELKEENLLENTVIDDVSPENADSEENETVEVLNNDEAPEFAAPGDPEEESEEADIVSELTEQMDSSVEVEVVDTDPGDVAASVAPATKPKKAKAGKEFFKKRAVDEVSSHQMVEHVFALDAG